MYARRLEQPSPADLRNTQKFPKILSSVRFTSELQGDLWGAAFWEMRQLFGQSPTDKLLFDSWLALQPPDMRIAREEYAERLVSHAPPNGKSEIKAIFERRDLKF